jgi:hypothetical protein
MASNSTTTNPPRGAKSLYEITLHKTARQIIRNTESGFNTYSSLPQKLQADVFHQLQKQVHLSNNKSSKGVKSLFEITLHKAAYEMMHDTASGFDLYISLPWKLQADIFRYLQKEVLRDKWMDEFLAYLRAYDDRRSPTRMEENRRWVREVQAATERQLRERQAANQRRLREAFAELMETGSQHNASTTHLAVAGAHDASIHPVASSPDSSPVAERRPRRLQRIRTFGRKAWRRWLRWMDWLHSRVF